MLKLPPFASELWIMTSSGLPLLHRAHQGDYQGELFAGLVSAITHFAEDIFTEQCQVIKLNSSKFTLLYHTKPDLIFLCRSEPQTQQKRVIFYLEGVRDLFLEEFGEVFGGLDGLCEAL